MRHFAHKECGKSHHKFSAHRILFNEHGILHRDISLNNLLLYRPKEDEDADGVLIDFDYSEELDIIDSDSDAKESEASINEAADVEGGEASTNEATSGIDSIRTVCSHLINVQGND